MKLERWIRGERTHKFTVQLGHYSIVIAEESEFTTLANEPVQHRKAFSMSREDAEWLRWALDEALKSPI
jgi:hypothetical protein